jgi:hypothetical protein
VWLSLRVEQDVVRLEVTVQNRARVRAREHAGEPAHERQAGATVRVPAGRDRVHEAAPFHELQNEEIFAAVAPPMIHYSDDARVAAFQSARVVQLVLKRQAGVLRLGPSELQGEQVTAADTLGEMHHRRAPLADFSQQAVVADDTATGTAHQ